MLYIKEHLKEKNIQVQELANRLGISRQALSKQLAGALMVETLERIAAAMDIEPYKLLLPPDATQSTQASGCVCPSCGKHLRIVADD